MWLVTPGRDASLRLEDGKVVAHPYGEARGRQRHWLREPPATEPYEVARLERSGGVVHGVALDRHRHLAFTKADEATRAEADAVFRRCHPPNQQATVGEICRAPEIRERVQRARHEELFVEQFACVDTRKLSRAPVHLRHRVFRRHDERVAHRLEHERTALLRRAGVLRHGGRILRTLRIRRRGCQREDECDDGRAHYGCFERATFTVAVWPGLTVTSVT